VVCVQILDANPLFMVSGGQARSEVVTLLSSFGGFVVGPPQSSGPDRLQL